jgi:hypothetical protein
MYGTLPVTQCHIPEEWNPQPHCCENLKTCEHNVILMTTTQALEGVQLHASSPQQQTEVHGQLNALGGKRLQYH